MSSQGAIQGISPLIDALGARGNEAAGNQAQVGQHLILMQRLVAAIEGGGGSFTGLYTVYSWSSGDLVIATAFPKATTGTFIIHNTAASTLTLPGTGGPWIVGDGLGNAGTYPITVNTTGGQTILGALSYVLAFNWQCATFILDGTNYIIA